MSDVKDEKKVVVQNKPVPAGPVNPDIVPPNKLRVVVVKKPHTTPARAAITLKTSGRFDRNGTLTVTGNSITFFDKAGKAIKFDGKDNVFTGKQLTAGVTILAESTTPSAAVDDVELKLDLAPGAPPAGPAKTLKLTAVELHLEICRVRHPLLPCFALSDPTTSTPPPGTPDDKWFGGKLLLVQDSHGALPREILRVLPPEPSGFACDLLLRQINIAKGKIAGTTNRVRLFPNLEPTSGEAVIATPHTFKTTDIKPPAGVLDFFMQGQTASSARLDTGFQLGIAGVENDGDRVAVSIGVGPVIFPALTNAILAKPHTQPARQPVTISVGGSFGRKGTLERSGKTDIIKLFRSAKGGTELAFDGKDNVFGGAELSKGVKLFAEAAKHSDNADDYKLKLTLDPGGPADVPVGDPAEAVVVGLELTLDICGAPTTIGGAPPPMPQPPAAPPPPDTAADKWHRGQFLQARDVGNNQGRVQLIVAAHPSDTTGVVRVRQVKLAGDKIGALDNARAQIFDNPAVTAGEAAKGNPLEIKMADVKAAGGQVKFFVEGQVAPSTKLRDAALQLGLKDVEDDGDRVALTVAQLTQIKATIRPTPPTHDRAGIAKPADHVFTSNNLADGFAVNVPLTLIRNGQPDVALEVTCRPANLPILWKAVRNPADHASLGNAAALPTITPNPKDATKATLNANDKGSFRVRPFLDTNGSTKFDAGEPSIPLNLILADVTVAADNSAVHPGVQAVSFDGAGNFRVSNGSFAAGLAGAAIGMNLDADVTGGGADGQLGLDFVQAGLINNLTVLDVVATYREMVGGVPHDHRLAFIIPANADKATGNLGGRKMFKPGDKATELHEFPVLDSGRTPAGLGGETATMGHSDPPTTVPRAVGQRWTIQCLDSPGVRFPPAHPNFPAAVLTRVHADFRFVANFCFWTNSSRNRGATGDPADRTYSVVRIVSWQIVGDWSITHPVGGPVAAATTPHNVLIVDRRTISPINRAQDNNIEVRPPGAIHIAGWDGRP